jgi:hypothetical protein
VIEAAEEKPDRAWVSIVRAWGAAVLRPYMIWAKARI